MLNHASAGTLLEDNSGRDDRGRPWREPRSCDHRPRGQWDGDYSLEPNAGHSEEARVHVAPPAQDLVLILSMKHCAFHVPFTSDPEVQLSHSKIRGFGSHHILIRGGGI